jgi:hypothetical protein
MKPVSLYGARTRLSRQIVVARRGQAKVRLLLPEVRAESPGRRPRGLLKDEILGIPLGAYRGSACLDTTSARVDAGRVLPWRHFEPFARILIARAVAETPPVITADRDRRRDAVEFIR